MGLLFLDSLFNSCTHQPPFPSEAHTDGCWMYSLTAFCRREISVNSGSLLVSGNIWDKGLASISPGGCWGASMGSSTALSFLCLLGRQVNPATCTHHIQSNQAALSQSLFLVFGLFTKRDSVQCRRFSLNSWFVKLPHKVGCGLHGTFLEGWLPPARYPGVAMSYLNNPHSVFSRGRSELFGQTEEEKAGL